MSGGQNSKVKPREFGKAGGYSEGCREDCVVRVTVEEPETVKLRKNWSRKYGHTIPSCISNISTTLRRIIARSEAAASMELSECCIVSWS